MARVQQPEAASGEGPEQTFVANREKLSPQLICFLRTMKPIGNPRDIVRATSGGVKNARLAETNDCRGAAGDGETTESR